MRIIQFFVVFLLWLPVTYAGPTRVSLIPGEQYGETLLRLLDEGADQGSPIDILHFNFFTEEGTTRRVAQKLIEIKQRKLDLPIRLILEGEKDLDKPGGAAARNLKTLEFFRDSGVEVRFITGSRQNGVKGVTHAKAVRVGNLLLTGSTNLTNTSITKNNEMNFLVDSQEIAEGFGKFVDALLADSGRLHEVFVSVPLPEGKVEFLTDTLFQQKALGLIGEAQKGDALDVTTYFFAVRGESGDAKAKEIFDAIGAAQERGVDIRVYLERNDNPKINQTITEANEQVARMLNEKGIRVYLDPPGKISHFKIIRLSGPAKKAVLSGSTNLYRGDISDNHQVNVYVENAALTDSLGAYLNQKIAYEGERFGHNQTFPMLRFWLGRAQNREDLAPFRAGVNRRLIPETTLVGAGRGLDAYLPAFPSRGSYDFIPDEVALIAYSGDEAYQAIRTTPKGSQYGPLHFEKDMFAKAGSGSQVAP